MIPFLDAALKSVHKQCYDDAIDRLNYYYSTMILLFLSILTTAKQYVGKPIQCWVPAQFRGGWEQYAENYCFIQNTYYIPFEKELPKSVVERDYRKIGYYQWVPIVLAVQALFFYLPNVTWKLLNWQSGVNVKSILKIATLANVPETEKRQEAVKTLARYVKDSLDTERFSSISSPMSQFKIRWSSRRTNAYLTSLYMLTKLLFLVNVVGQFFLMNAFLGTEYKFWGWQILIDLLNGKEWQVSGHFPRVTLCDFSVREMGNNVHNHSVQCVLMINMFNEKIYIFLWFWMLLVATATAVNFLYWILIYLPRNSRDKMVAKFLRVGVASKKLQLSNQFSMKDGSHNDKLIHQLSAMTWKDFSQNVLKMDGALLLRFISTHAGEMIAAELTCQLFSDFEKEANWAGPLKTPAMNGKAFYPEDRVPLTEGFNEKLIDHEKQQRDLIDGKQSTGPVTQYNYPGPPPPKVECFS